MEKEELISVIIPMHNVESYIERCLKSISTGTYHNIEILCIDDGSTDNTVTVVEHLQAEDNRIKLFCLRENKGVSSTRNRGLQQASGSYIAFIDADDWVTEEYLSVLYEIAKEKQADMTICDFYGVSRFIPFGPPEPEYSVYEVPEKDRYGSWKPSVWGVLYRREICPFFNENLSRREDILFNTQIVSQGEDLKIWKCTKHMYFYFYHNDSLTRSGDAYRYYHLSKELLDEMDSFPIKKYAVILAGREALAFRYHNFGKNKGREKELFHRVLPLLIRCKDLPMKDKLIHIFAIFFPFIYSWRRKNTR